MPRSNAKHHTQRLRGKRFEPPRKPDLLTSSLVTALGDHGKGRQLGKGHANEFDMTDEEGRLVVDKQVDEQVERATTDQQYRYADAIGAAEQTRSDAIEQQADGQREIDELLGTDLYELGPKEEAMGERHGPSRLGYGLLLACVFLMLLPADVGAAQLLPLAPVMQLLLGVLLGAGMTWAAHVAAKKLADLWEAHRTRGEDAFGYSLERVQVVAAISIPLLVIVGTAVMRGQVFMAAERATGGIVQGSAANVAIAFFGVLGFAIAVMFGLAYHRVKPLRDVRARRAANLAKRKTFQRAVDTAERVERQAEVTIAFLEQRRDHTIVALRHWGEERKARIHRIGINVALRSEIKRSKKDDGPDEPPRGRMRRPRPTAGGPQLRSVDLDGLADQVQVATAAAAPTTNRRGDADHDQVHR